MCFQNVNLRAECFKSLERQQHRFSNWKGKAELKREKLCMDPIIVDQKLVEIWFDFW